MKNKWVTQTQRCLEWFLGRNDLGAPLYDYKTGGCCDGLGPNGPNRNQGAESTLACVLSLLNLYQMGSVQVAVGAHIWISFSPDMKHWGDHQILIPARRGGWWDANNIGLAPPPLRTEKGWLILYHGVRMTPSGCIYRLGLALLDLEDPTRLLARSDEWVFALEESYEVVGDVDKVVFPCGWVTKGDEVRLYYGGADKCIALATARVTEMLDWVEKHKQTEGE